MRPSLILALLLSCGSEPPPTPPDPASLFPVAVGNRWEYRVAEPGKLEQTKTQSVTRTATSSAGDGFLFETVNGPNRTVSIQRLDGARLVRVSEESFANGALVERIHFEPPALRVDTHTPKLGDTYSTTHDEILVDGDGDPIGPRLHKSTTFLVEAIDESVTVPAGTFSTVRIRRTVVGGSAKTYWFAEGVGKVKEVGGQTESLVSYDVDG
ncbi:MAG: hypothetical protein HY791_26040 [Deltaproteobacteria bacterium]|nr:hypothetical protein [Deltaproteobacteria bacterium]